MTDDTRWFTKIGLAYAGHHDDIETARETFLTERRRLLHHLGGQATAMGVSPVVESEFYLSCYPLVTNWGRIRSADRKAGKAGITFAIGNIPYFGAEAGVAFAAYSFFQMGPPAFKRLPPDLMSDPSLRIEQKDGFARFCHKLISISNPAFTLNNLEVAVASLAAAFAPLDQRVSGAYEEEPAYTDAS